MFIDEPAPSDPDGTTVTAIPARLLLASCAREAARQARQIALMDEAFGTALAPARSGGQGTPNSDALFHALRSRLQEIDRLRQEAQGLADVLHLLAAAPTETDVPTDRIRACTPLVALRDRLVQERMGTCHADRMEHTEPRL